MSAADRAVPPRPFGHFRLAAFFAAVTLLALVSGLLRLRAAGLTDAGWILASSVLLAAGLGFLGVLVHRLRVLPLRWRETEEYLKAIRRESVKYRALLEGAADPLLVVDAASGRIREWSARAREDLGLRPAPAEAPELAALVHADDRERLLAALRQASSTPGQPVSVDEVRLRGERPRIAGARLAAVALEGEQVVQVALRDLTAQKEIERKLQIHERLTSIGLLTAGVAHEINNPLEGIGNHLLLLEREGGDAEKRARHLGLVRHGFERIGEIVRDLLRFARPAPGGGEADLAQVVERARKLSAYSKRLEGVAVETRGLEAPLRVVGDPGRLEQVLFNLLLNAGTAAGRGGTIRIEARELPDGDAGPACVEISVSDSGPGIPPADLERVFDPFFTTTGGTGLGLSVCYGIVRAHGGTISAANRPEGGARIAVRLPRGGDA